MSYSLHGLLERISLFKKKKKQHSYMALWNDK